MHPGTGNNRQQKDFTHQVDELLASQAGKAGEPGDSTSQANLDFAKKVIANRANPSPAFRDNLKQRLLNKLAEQETAKITAFALPHSTSFRTRLQSIIPSRPVWGMAVGTAVLVVALLVVWQMGVFTPQEHTLMTVQNGGRTVAVEAQVADLKQTYTAGDEIMFRFSFKNVTADTVTFSFPPAVSIENAAFEAVRSFAAGQALVTLYPGEAKNWVLTWDQQDAAGQPVSPGDYHINISGRSPAVGGGTVSLDQPLTVTILPAP